jgi:hypothetical protein
MNPHGLTWSVDPTAFAERAVVDGFVNTGDSIRSLR